MIRYWVFAALMAAFWAAGWCIGRIVHRLRRAKDTAPPSDCRLCGRSDHWFLGAFVAIAVNNPDVTAIGRAITADLYELPQEDS
jgi:hypothetical protein